MACLSTQIAELNVELAKYKKQLADLEAELQTAKEAEPRDKKEIDKIEARIERKEDAIKVKEVRLTGLEADQRQAAAQAQPGVIHSLP
jgi:chromosome segregation ATPase